MNCSTIKRYGNTLSGMNYLHVNNMEYCHVESLSNNMIREITCNIEEKWMKVRERSYNSDSCIEINLNELKIHDIIDFYSYIPKNEKDQVSLNEISWRSIIVNRKLFEETIYEIMLNDYPYSLSLSLLLI